MSTVYDVRLRLATEGNFAASLGDLTGRAGAAQEKVERIGESGKRAGEMLASMGERVGGALEGLADRAIDVSTHIAKIGAAAVIGVAAYGVAHLNNELEQTKISLGAIAQAQGFTKTFEEGFAMAGDQLSKMKQDVKTLPGDLGQLSNMMKMIATPAAQGGASMDQIRLLAGKTMLTAQILGVDQEMAAREMAGLMSGRAGSHNILGARLGLIGDAGKSFNADTASGRLKTITKDLDKYQGAADRFGQSFIANWTTLKDNVKYGLIAESTAPLFERVKQSLAEINTWFDTHKDKVRDLTVLVGQRLVGAWNTLEEGFKRIEPYVERIADKFLRMQPGEVVAKLRRGAEEVIGLKIAGSAISVGSGMIPGLMKMGVGSAGAAVGGEGLLGGLAAAAPAAGLALGAAAAAGVVLGGVLDNLSDSTRQYHDADVAAMEELGKGFRDLARDAAPVGDSLHQVADYLGHETLATLVMFTDSIVSLVSQLKKEWGPVFDHPFENFEDQLTREKFRQSRDVAGPIDDHDVVGRHLIQMSKGEAFGTKTNPKVDPKAAPTINVGPIQITVEGNQDPTRVARLVGDHLMGLARNPKGSKYVADYSAPR